MRLPINLLPVSGFWVLASSLFLLAQSGGKQFSYEEVFENGGRGITASMPETTGWLDDDTYLEIRSCAGGSRRVYAVEAADGRARVYRDYAEIQRKLPSGFDPARAELATPDLTRFVFNREGDLYFYDLPNNSFHRLTVTPGAEQNPRFSPDARWIAYTRGGNLFAYDLEKRIEHQYTTDGADSVSNGWASWVYYEEILGRDSQYAAFWWSPDSRRLAYMRFDDTPVPQFPIFHARGPHGELELQRYPKAGDANPYVSIGVVGVLDGRTVWMDFEGKADHYLAWPFWNPDSSVLTVQWMNRGQNAIRLYNCDPATGHKSLIYEERQPAWVRFFEDLHWLQNGGFLLRSDNDGWDHLYYCDGHGKLKRRLTSGKWNVDAIVRVDEAGGWVYFTGRPGKTWDAQLLRVSLEGGAPLQLTQEQGVHRVQLSPGGRYFIDTVSNLASPAVMSLHQGDGKLIRRLGDSRTAAMKEYAWGKAELFTIPSGDGFDLPAYWILPVGFDAAKAYPVIFSVYGGPGATMVRNSWLGLQPYYWAQRGVIWFAVDHRGSGHFGKQAEALMHRNLGKWETADLIAAAKWLRSKPFVARGKIGITGSSYGGYTTLLALTRGSGYFDFGQAASAVTDWRLYDTVYTERYMDLPSENPEGYSQGSILNWIANYKGGAPAHAWHGG